MAGIKARLLALEALRPIEDATESTRHVEHAVYMACVMIGFTDPDPAGAMIRRGIPEDEARRFVAMGFHAAQRELMAKLHELMEVARGR